MGLNGLFMTLMMLAIYIGVPAIVMFGVIYLIRSLGRPSSGALSGDKALRNGNFEILRALRVLFYCALVSAFSFICLWAYTLYYIETTPEWVIAGGDKAGLDAILAKGANVNSRFFRDDFGDRPLTLAARQGHVDIAAALIAKGADINATDNAGRTPLMVAAQGGSLQLVQLLLDKGADVNAKTPTGATALTYAAAQGDYVEIVRLLLDKGANIDARTKHGYTALRYAVENDAPETVKELVARGADVGVSKSNFGRQYPADRLVSACEACKLDYVRVFIATGSDADGDYRTPNFDRPLIAASRSNCLDVVQFLIAAEAKVEAKNIGGDNALIVASDNGHLGVVKALLSAGANVNATKYVCRGITGSACGPGGDSVLLGAIKSGHLDIVQALLAAGAKVNREFLNQARDPQIEALLKSALAQPGFHTGH